MEIGELVASFNQAVGDGRWEPYLQGFTDSATVEFVGPPVGPFHGIAAIREAYEAAPPDDTIELLGGEEAVGDELVCRYRWRSTGATGTMRRRLSSDGRVQRLVITFD